MSEQNTEVTNDEVHTPDPVEVEARAGGWVPKEEFHGDEKLWVDAGEFVRRGPLFEKINRQGSELKEIKKALEQLKHHHAQVKETAYKDALKALREQKREAFAEGDADKLIAIDEKIDAVRDEQRTFEQSRAQQHSQQVTQELHPEMVAWTNRNPWYNTSRPMRAFADALGMELAAEGKSPSDVLKEVERRVRAEFPNKFENPNRSKASAVEGGGNTGSSGKGRDSFQLEDHERQIMQRFVRTGVMTEAEYIAELKATKGIK